MSPRKHPRSLSFRRPKTRRFLSSSPRAAKDAPLPHPVGTDAEGSRFGLTDAHRRTHMHVIGASGGGKSKFLEYLIRQDIRRQQAGLCFVDPHGKTYADLVHYLATYAPHLAERVVLFDPVHDADMVLGFNPIPSDVEDLDYLIETLIEACLKAWGQNDPDRTPRIRRWLGNIFYPIVVNRLSLIEALPLVNVYNEEGRARLLQNVRRASVLEAWRELESLPLRQRSELLEGVGNRLEKFISYEIIRNVLGQDQRILDLQHVVSEGQILLVNLHGENRVREDHMRLLGILLINELFRVSKLRNPRDPYLKPFHLYIDEFAQFVSRDIDAMLAECRKYGVFLTLAHQHLDQLKSREHDITASVLTNCKTKVVFGDIRYEDAQVMARELFADHLDLKEVKHEIWQTKERHRETTRVVRSRSGSEGGTHNQAFSRALGGAHSESAQMTEGWGQQTSQSVAEGDSESRNRAHNRSLGYGEQETANWGESASEGTSESVGTHESTGSGWNQGTSHTTGTTRQEHQGWSSQHTRHLVDDTLTLASGLQGGTGLAHTDSETESSGVSGQYTQGSSRNRGHNRARGRFLGGTRGTHRNLQAGESEGLTQGTHRQRTQGHGTNRSHSRGHGTNDTVSWQATLSEGRAQNWSQTEGISVVPFHEVEPYEELSSRQYYALPEQWEKVIGRLKNQPVGGAHVKLSGTPPVAIQVDPVPDLFHNSVYTEQDIAAFKQAVFTHHADYYTPVREARQHYQIRQTTFFGRPIQFDEHELAEATGASEPPALPPAEDAAENPFS